MCQSSQMLQPDCASCAARNGSVFAELRPLELDTLSEAKGCRTYHKGEIIFFADDNPTGLFCIRSGTVKIYKVGRDGREQIIRLARGGDILGYRSLISGETYGTFAVPIGDAQVCHVPKDTFVGLSSKSVGLSMQIMKLLADELRIAEEKMVEMAQKPGRRTLSGFAGGRSRSSTRRRSCAPHACRTERQRAADRTNDCASPGVTGIRAPGVAQCPLSPEPRLLQLAGSL